MICLIELHCGKPLRVLLPRSWEFKVKKNHERDAMSDENLVPIIAVGFILAVLLHVLIYVVVKIIIWQSGVS